MPFRLVSERPEHERDIVSALDRAFGPGRFAKTSERVRERGAVLEPGLSRVALDEKGAVLGCCRIWRIGVGEAQAFFLGPLAVDPVAQHGGVGLALARDATAACRAVGGGCVILVGALAFFKPLGFLVAPRGQIVMPGPVDPDRLLWLELAPGGLDKISGAIGAPS
ncbi:MAG: N-acetyltransferase [Pseudomonadota bacterium]